MHFNYSDILIMTDIDGTLAVDEKISEENIRAIKSFTQKGGFFTVASGRTPSYIKEKYLDVIDVNAPVASINGSIISKDEKVYFHVPMPDDCGKIIKKARKLAKIEKALLYRPEKTVFIPEGEEENCKNGYKILLTFYDEKEALLVKSALLDEFGDEYMILRSWNVGLEINSRSSGKGRAIKKIKEITGAKIAIGVGNYENDIPLLEGADIKIAVGNSIDELKEIADIVTISCEDNAIAYILENIEKITK